MDNEIKNSKIGQRHIEKKETPSRTNRFRLLIWAIDSTNYVIHVHKLVWHESTIDQIYDPYIIIIVYILYMDEHI